jgi:hypothetical protein
MRVGALGFFLRISFCILLVFVTYNPAGWSYFHWIQAGWENNMPIKVLAGIALLIAVLVCARATYRSIKIVGVVLVAALLAALVWVAYDLELLDVKKPGVMQWILLLAVGLIMGVGLSWSIVRRMISGQLDVLDGDGDGDGEHDH